LTSSPARCYSTSCATCWPGRGFGALGQHCDRRRVRPGAHRRRHDHRRPARRAGLSPDPDDDYLIALARIAEADYLVSGDRHLTAISDPIAPVLTPREFRDRLTEPPSIPDRG
jgi:hypothetical protein